MKMQAKPRVPRDASTSPADAAMHFRRKLDLETDPSDVFHDLEHDLVSFVVVDARQSASWRDCRIPGALSLPYATIREATVDALDRSRPVVVYCWGPACNAATHAAARLADLGFTVREMIGGLEYWRREGYPVEGDATESRSLVGP